MLIVALAVFYGLALFWLALADHRDLRAYLLAAGCVVLVTIHVILAWGFQ